MYWGDRIEGFLLQRPCHVRRLLYLMEMGFVPMGEIFGVLVGTTNADIKPDT